MDPEGGSRRRGRWHRALRQVPFCLVVLLAACSTGPAASSPDAVPSITARPSIEVASPGPTKIVVEPSKGGDDVFTGILAGDSIEGGCAFLQTDDGRRFEVIYPDGWRLQRSPLELIAPDGSVHSRAGDEVTVRGAEADDLVSICQVGPIVRAMEVLDR